MDCEGDRRVVSISEGTSESGVSCEGDLGFSGWGWKGLTCDGKAVREHLGWVFGCHSYRSCGMVCVVMRQMSE